MKRRKVRLTYKRAPRWRDNRTPGSVRSEYSDETIARRLRQLAPAERLEHDDADKEGRGG